MSLKVNLRKSVVFTTIVLFSTATQSQIADLSNPFSFALEPRSDVAIISIPMKPAIG